MTCKRNPMKWLCTWKRFLKSFSSVTFSIHPIRRSCSIRWVVMHVMDLILQIKRKWHVKHLPDPGASYSKLLKMSLSALFILFNRSLRNGWTKIAYNLILRNILFKSSNLKAVGEPLTFKASNLWHNICKSDFWSSAQWGGVLGENFERQQYHLTVSHAHPKPEAGLCRFMLWRTNGLLVGDVTLLVGDCVENFTWASVGWLGLDVTGWSKWSSSISPLSSSCWLTSFNKSITSSIDTGN